MAEKSIEAINTKRTSPCLSINEITNNTLYRKQRIDTSESQEVTCMIKTHNNSKLSIGVNERMYSCSKERKEDYGTSLTPCPSPVEFEQEISGKQLEEQVVYCKQQCLKYVFRLSQLKAKQLDNEVSRYQNILRLLQDEIEINKN